MDKELVKQAIEHIDSLEKKVGAYEQVLDWISTGLIDPTDGFDKVAAILAGNSVRLPNPISLGESVEAETFDEVTKTASSTPEQNVYSKLIGLSRNQSL